MRKECIIMMGLPLSGKTTWVNNNLDLTQYMLVSADNLKISHPEYDPKNTEILHEWSVKEAERLMEHFSSEGKDIVFDSGSINNNYTIRIIDMLKSKDYFVKLVHIKTPYRVCLQRNKERHRTVPESAIIQKAIKETSMFHKLTTYVNEYEVVEHFTNNHIFIDMDGVIAALGTLPIINGEIDFVNSQIYKYLTPVTPVIEKLKNLQFLGYKLYILSAIPNSFSYIEKNEWLDKYFNIPKENRFFVNQGKHKAEMLDNLTIHLKIDKKDVVIIEDIHQTLYDVENRFMNSMHVSEFLIYKFKPIKE